MYDDALEDTSVSVPMMTPDQIAALEQPMLSGQAKGMGKDLRVSEETANRATQDTAGLGRGTAPRGDSNGSMFRFTSRAGPVDDPRQMAAPGLSQIEEERD